MKRFIITIYGDKQVITFCQIAKDVVNARIVAQYIAQYVFKFTFPLTMTREYHENI